MRRRMDLNEAHAPGVQEVRSSGENFGVGEKDFRRLRRISESWIQEVCKAYSAIGSDAMSEQTTAVKYASLRDRAYWAIKDAIIHCRYKPGEPLLEERVSRELGVSRTPVREALRELQRDGLVRYIQGKGAFVADISIQDVHEVFFLRRVLEAAALRVTIQRYRKEDLEPLIELFSGLDRKVESLDYDALFESDIRLHGFIVDMAGNKRLTHFVSVLGDQIERLRRVSATMPGRMRQSLEEHRAILAAIQARDVESAESRLMRHLNNVEKTVLVVSGY